MRIKKERIEELLLLNFKKVQDKYVLNLNENQLVEVDSDGNIIMFTSDIRTIHIEKDYIPQWAFPIIFKIALKDLLI